MLILEMMTMTSKAKKISSKTPSVSMSAKQTNKTLDTLVEDIYSVLQHCESISDDLVKELVEDLTGVIKGRLTQPSHRRDTLSLSSIGKPLRKLWYDLKEPCEEQDEPPYKQLKFLYGDIIESLILWLAKVAGHTVTDRQKEVTHHGIKGHIDSIIDGEVVDAKSCSSRSYKKFEKGTLPEDDPFGYLSQIGSYNEETGKGHPGFLAVDKVTGEVCLYRPDPDFDLPDTEQIIKNCKDALAKDTPPEQRCYPDEPMGKSGNRVLSKSCTFCPYKKRCWPGLRAFNYSSGTEYLTHVEKEPSVEEIKEF